MSAAVRVVPGARGELVAGVERISYASDGLLRVELAVRCERDLGARLTHASVGVRRRFRLTEWRPAKPSVTYLPPGETTGLTLATAEAPQFDHLFVYLETDAGVLELGPPARTAPISALLTGGSAVLFWLLSGPRAAVCVLVGAFIIGAGSMRATTRPAVSVWDPQRLSRYWPALALCGAIVVYVVGGGAADFANHAFNGGWNTALLVAAFGFAGFLWAIRLRRFRRLTRHLNKFQDVEPIVVLLVSLLLVGAFAAVAPSTRAARLAAIAFCRRQASLPPIPHRRDHITVEQAGAAFARMPGIIARLQSDKGLTSYEYLSTSGAYWLGDLAVYVRSADAAFAFSNTGWMTAAVGVPITFDQKLVQNVVLQVGRTDYRAEKCTLLGRLERLQ